MAEEPSESGPPRLRKIIHVDMDAFYASVEQRDDPSLRGKPLAVGGARARGVVAAASYEARRFGVRSAMPSVTAQRKCPDLIFVRPRFDVYRAVSAQIRDIFAEFTALIEPLSLDEAYLDVTGGTFGDGSATRIAEAIRARIRAETGLTASAGVSYNKFLAKMASDQRKPDGLFVIRPTEGADFVAALPIGKFHGIGPATAARMQRLGVETGADLRGLDLEVLQRHFGKVGRYYYWLARGRDDRPVSAERVRKSVSAETTYDTDLFTAEAVREALAELAGKVWRHCAAAGVAGRTVTLKLRHPDFQQATRSRTLALPVDSLDSLIRVAHELAGADPAGPKGIRLLGVGLSSLGPVVAPVPPPQLPLPL